MITSCSNQSNQGNVVTVQSNDVPGFNVQNFATLVKKTSDAASIEKAINEPNNNVNGLDLNKDGNTDFLSVAETAQGIQVVDNDINPAVTVATLNVKPGANQQANMSIQGNQQYCGPDYSYQSNFTLTDFLLLNYMLRPHVYYYPHYAYGYHPGYYHSYSVSTYRTRVYPTGYRSVSSGSSYRNTSSTGAYKSTPSTPQRSSLSSPTSSQRSFQVNKSNTGGFRSSGFGGSSHSSFGSSSHSSFGSSSRSSFGGSSSSFGGGGRRR